MIYQPLNLWIAQSESWQAFIDYRLDRKVIPNYGFLERYDDFYISLLSQLYDLLKKFEQEESADLKSDFVAVAKGLEIYSLENKRENFRGINFKRNLLYIASLYYLADFPATSYLLLRKLTAEDYSTELELFLFFFLSKKEFSKNTKQNNYYQFLFSFLKDGDSQMLQNCVDKINSLLDDPSELDRHEFVPLLLTRALLRKFDSTNLWNDLLKFGDTDKWKLYIRFCLGKSPAVWNFFPSQREAIEKGLFTFENSFSLQTPTSSGKTTISELVIYNEFIKDTNTKVLYLSPYRALASELRQTLSNNLRRFKIKVKAIYGGALISDEEKHSFETATVLISTPEKFLAVENSITGVLDQFKLVICDEGHLIDDNTRGVSYELLLSRLKSNPIVKRKFLFLSAIIPNIETINLWLGGTKDQIGYSNYRPTELELGSLAKTKPYTFSLTINPYDDVPKKFILNNILIKSDFLIAGTRHFNPTTFISQSCAIALKSLNVGVVAIFVPQKGGTSGVVANAEKLLELLPCRLPSPLSFSNPESVQKLQEYFSVIFGSRFSLTECIKNGYLYHHGDLPQFVREIIETEIRKENIKLLLCTTTLAEGVNLPIRTLVISSINRFDPNKKKQVPIEKRGLKNLIGRAGRAGKERKGTVIVVNPGDVSFVSNVFRSSDSNKVTGFLFRVLEAIKEEIIDKGLPVSNEMLEAIEQSDIIDNAIIQAIAEDIDTDTLQENIENLVKQTLSYYEADTSLKGLLRQLFLLRSEKIEFLISNRKIGLIKVTGLKVSMYERLESIVSYTEPIFDIVNIPTDNDWIDFVINTFFDLDAGNNFLPNDTLDSKKSKLKTLIVDWLNGLWFDTIANHIDTSVDNVLKLFQSLLHNTFQNTVSGFIRYVENKRASESLITPAVITEWPNYLHHGVKNKTELSLIEIGVCDRIGAITIAAWLEGNNISYSNNEELKSIIFQNQKSLQSELILNCPLVTQSCFQIFLERIM